MDRLTISPSHLMVGDKIIECDKFPNVAMGTVVYCDGDPHMTHIKVEGSISINPGGKLDMRIASGKFLIERKPRSSS
jgi:hypothetical protein